MSSSSILLLTGALIAATGAILLGLFGGGLISSIDVLTWKPGQTTSPVFEQTLPAIIGGALYLVGLCVASLGVWQVASSAVVNDVARSAFLLVGISMVAGGAQIVRSIGGAFAVLQIVASSDLALDPTVLREGIAETMSALTLGGWLLLPAPLIIAAAIWAGADPARKPGETSLPPIVPLVGMLLAASVGIGASVWSWLAWSECSRLMAGRMPRPNEVVESLDSMLAANFILGAVIVLAAMPAAMAALGMASGESEVIKPAAESANDKEQPVATQDEPTP